MKLSEKDKVQEDEYLFPYHHLLNRNSLRAIEYYGYLNRIKELIKKTIRRGLILDVGCGDGKGTKELANSFPNVMGLDYSSRAIRFARAFSPRIEFQVLDLIENNTAQLPQPYQADLIVCMEVIEHIPPSQLPAFINNLSSSLKEDGYLIITTPTPKMALPEKHYQHFSRKKLQQLLSPLFQEITVEYQQRRREYKLFYFLRGLFTNRYYELQSKSLNRLFKMIYTAYVKKAYSKNGQRIIYLAQKKNYFGASSK